ncbi:hypothetical protein [uncultured Desulfovibrio sp.]|uniref:hypothetical protein n=1 Tax=uncultured Desulfovibrio sp. TaxID=167968 RepID=UPI0025E9B53D|nr:hypothetical protein [uncultured Desulfovibrio sp.]
MEKLLLRLARQLDALDEASLMALWSKYATLTSRFEPTRRWEEGALVFSLIQAKHWKNQLFNYCWREQRRPPDAPAGAPVDASPRDAAPAPDFALERAPEPPAVPCRVLSFRPSRTDAGTGPKDG